MFALKLQVPETYVECLESDPLQQKERGSRLLGRSLALYIDAMANPIRYSVLASPK